MLPACGRKFIEKGEKFQLKCGFNVESLINDIKIDYWHFKGFESEIE